MPQKQILEVKDIAIGAGGHEFDNRAGQIGQCCRLFPTAAMFFRSHVVQALSRGDGPRHLLHASA